MDFTKLKEYLKDNAEALTFITSLETKQTESNAKLLSLAEEVDTLKASADDVQKYKDEAKQAFAQRDELKKQLNDKNGNAEQDKVLLETIEANKAEIGSLREQIATRDKDSALNDAISGLNFKGEGAAKESLKNTLKAQLSDGLIIDPTLGIVYADENGKPRRNPNDASTFMTPKTMLETSHIKDLLAEITGVSSGGDGFNGGNDSGGSDAGKDTSLIGKKGGMEQIRAVAKQHER
jgi:hypothetical protein